MIHSLNDFKKPFFIGIAGTGMSAIAQYLNGIGKLVSGSDRYFNKNEAEDIRRKLTNEGILCFPQDGSGIKADTDLIVVSTAVENTVPEVQQAIVQNIPIIRRSELLAIIASSKKTIAVGGTSGKSTTSAMLFDILQHAELKPSIISGAGLVSIIREGKIGNAKVGKGEWLVIEADESDGSIVQYHAEIGLLLNVDKDHKEIDVLMDIFKTFQQNSKKFIVNRTHPLATTLSVEPAADFAVDIAAGAGFTATDFHQTGLAIRFLVNDIPFSMNTVGRHNMENALAAAAVAAMIGVPLNISAASISGYEGIYRRHQVLGTKNGITLIDDYAHNPVKCAASIAACQPVANKLIAWFQPHGYVPTKFLRKDFCDEISKVMRAGDEIWMSEIFYAGGTTTKDISANDLVDDLKEKGLTAYFVDNREDLIDQMRPHFTDSTVLLLMGARDPSLEQFASDVWEKL